MKTSFFLLLLLFPFLGQANVLELLKQNQGFSLQKHLKKDVGSLIPSSLKAQDFIQAFENKDLKTALKLWERSLANSSFAKSSNGSALYAYLLFQNGFELLSLNHLFRNSKAKDIDPMIYRLWKQNVLESHPVWEFFYFKLDPAWANFFSPELVFRLAERNHQNLDYPYMEQLLSLPVKKDFDTFSVEWFLMLSLLKKGDRDSATKLLSWFVSQEKRKDRVDYIHLTIARLLADISAVAVALEYYQKINPGSYFWLLAQEEMAWLLWSEKNYRQAYTKALALNAPHLSPSMQFILALLQLKNCDEAGSLQSLIRFKTEFSGRNREIQKLLKSQKKDFVIKELMRFYQSNMPYYALEIQQPFYLLRKDQNLKQAILLYHYAKQKPLSTDFKKLMKQRQKGVQALKKQIHNRLDLLLQAEAQNIQKYLKWFHLIEAELAYRKKVLKASSWELLSHWGSKVSVLKSDGFVYFPFDSRELWRDELSDYQWVESSKCASSSYQL